MFKVGDRIRNKTTGWEFIIVEITNDSKVIVKSPNNTPTKYPNTFSYFNFCDTSDFELIPNKFDVNVLKPFDQVLVRLTNNCLWLPKFFFYYDTDPKIKYYPFVTTDNIGYPQCIPYEGNEHLCRKTDNCDEFYKTWN